MVKANWVSVTCNRSTANAWHILLQSVDAGDAMRVVVQAIHREMDAPPTPKYILGVIASERRSRSVQIGTGATSIRSGDAVAIRELMAEAKNNLQSRKVDR